MPASAIEPLVLGPRVRDYSPAMLDELLATGEVTWSGAGSISGSDGWIALHAERFRAVDPGRARRDRLHRRPPRDPGHAGRRRRATSSVSWRKSGSADAELKAALWELIWAGWVTGDTFAPVRAALGGAGHPQALRPRRTGHIGRRA